MLLFETGPLVLRTDHYPHCCSEFSALPWFIIASDIDLVVVWVQICAGLYLGSNWTFRHGEWGEFDIEMLFNELAWIITLARFIWSSLSCLVIRSHMQDKVRKPFSLYFLLILLIKNLIKSISPCWTDEWCKPVKDSEIPWGDAW